MPFHSALAEVLEPEILEQPLPLAPVESRPLADEEPQPATDIAQALEEAIRFARSERELETALERVQAGFEAGQLSQAQVERLTWLAVEVARQLDAGLVSIPASAFLEDT